MRTVKSKLLVVCVVLGLLGAGQVVAEVQHIASVPLADAYVDDQNPGTNYGGVGDLYVGDENYNVPAKSCRTYMKFDVSVVPSGSTILSGKLYLRSWGIGPKPDIVVGAHYLADDSWLEGTINWTNSPKTYNASASDTQTINNTATWFVWDVTNDVKTAYAGDGVLSEVLVSTTEGSHSWCGFSSSEEYNASFRPHLQIAYYPEGSVIPGGTEGFNPEVGHIEFGGGSSLPPIPAGSFGTTPLSQEWSGTIALGGGTPMGGGGTPMVIERTEGIYLPDSFPLGTVDTEIVELELKSTDPIMVTYEDGADSFFDVYVTIDVANPPEGLMTIIRVTDSGGMFEYHPMLMGQPVIFTFVNVDDPLDTHILEIPGSPEFTDPITMGPTMGNWQTEPAKEAEVLGYDGFYASEGQTLHSELMYAGAPAGGLEYSTLQPVSPTFCITTADQWNEALNTDRVRPVTQEEFDDYRDQYNSNLDEGSAEYPPEAQFRPAQLYVYEPNESEGGDLCDGLVMYWGVDEPGTAEVVTAFRYTYPADPDLTGCVLTTTVYPPCGMLIVSIGLQDVNGNIRGWYWNVAAAGAGTPYPVGTIPCSPAPGPGPGAVPTNISIDLSKTGVTAATPVAASYSTGGAAFDITKITDYQFDEDNLWVDSTPTNPPGSGLIASWNYWKNIVVTKKTPPPAAVNKTKFYIKYSQGPDIIDPNADPKLIRGWDERSNYHGRPVVADDWLCEDDRAVTDVHWWGSFLNWNQPEPPPVVPQAFHIGIWTDMPVGADPYYPDVNFSHPHWLIWENYCESWAWEFYGYDLDPHWGDPDPNAPFEPWETCFQFEQFLSEDEWFKQDPNLPWPWGDDPCDPFPNGTVYWLSIAAVYNAGDVVAHPWGWKTRQPHWNDDAVRIWEVAPPNVDFPPGFPPSNWPPSMGYTWVKGDPIWWPTEADSWDMCFELTTKEPAYEDVSITGDLNADRTVNFRDIAILANNWLAVAPVP